MLMDIESDKLDKFIRDCSTLDENLRWTLSALRKHPSELALVHEAFRFVHSLKSEAEMVHAEEIAALAHEMEGFLDQMRKGSLSSEDGLPMLDSMTEALAPMVEALTSHSRAGGATRAAPGRSKTVSGGADSRPGFSEFEIQLIREAIERGESVYRLVCEIEESAPLKYPKAYLVANNLEISATVIKGLASPEGADDTSFRIFEIYLAGDLSEQEIRNAVDVDQVKVAKLERIAAEALIGPRAQRVLPSDFRAESDHVRSPRSWSSVRVENGKIDAILEYLGDLNEVLDRARSASRAGSGFPAIEGEVNAAAGIARHLQSIVERTGKVPIREEFDRLAMMARDLSTSLGRQIRFVTNGGELLVDRRLPALLSEPLAHLVRNAVDHGIEGREERSTAGKPPVGTVALSAEVKGGKLWITVSDDGRGIEARAVRERARALGLPGKEGLGPFGPGAGEAEGDATPEGILALLVQPGFSTRAQATRVSGRGVGLDLVNERIRGLFGGDLQLQTTFGKGTTFRILLPADSRITSLLVVRWKGRTFAVPERYLERVVEIDRSSFIRGENGRLRFEDLGVVTIDGAPTINTPNPPGFLIIVDCSGERAALLVDDLLFERDLPEARLELGAEEGRFLSHLLIGGKESDFLYLNPATLV